MCTFHTMFIFHATYTARDSRPSMAGLVVWRGLYQQMFQDVTLACSHARHRRSCVLYCVLCFTVAVFQPLDKLMMMMMMMFVAKRLSSLMTSCACGYIDYIDRFGFYNWTNNNKGFVRSTRARSHVYSHKHKHSSSDNDEGHCSLVTCSIRPNLPV